MNREVGEALLKLGRISNLPTVVSNVTVGYCLGGGQIQTTPMPWLVCVGAIACFYEAGMVLNDLCDYGVDLQERPDRPLPAGLISRFTATLIMGSLFLVGLGLLALYLPEVLIPSLGLVGLIIAYNVVHTHFGLAPVLMGACRGSIYLLAARAAGWRGDESSHLVWVMSFGLILYITAVSFIARDELKVVLGRVPRVSAAVAFGVLLWPVVFAPRLNSLVLLGLLPLGYWFVMTEIKLFRKRISPPQLVGRMLSGISLWDALVLATLSSMSGMGLAWVCFGGARLWQRRIQAT